MKAGDHHGYCEKSCAEKDGGKDFRTEDNCEENTREEDHCTKEDLRSQEECHEEDRCKESNTEEGCRACSRQEERNEENGRQEDRRPGSPQVGFRGLESTSWCCSVRPVLGRFRRTRVCTEKRQHHSLEFSSPSKAGCS